MNEKIKEIEALYKTSIDEIPRTIEAYDKKGDGLIYDVNVQVPLKEMQKMFNGQEHDPMMGFYKITEKEAKILEKITNEKIELDKYDYCIWLYAPDNKSEDEMSLPTIKEIEDIYKTSIDEIPRTIDAYDKKTEFIVKDITIKIPLRELQRIFNAEEHDPMVDIYDVYEKEARELEKYITEKIELDQYDYQIGLYAPE